MDDADLTPAESMADEPQKPEGKPPREELEKLPGDFLTDDLRDDTSRFLDEVKRQIKRRKEPRPEPKLGPSERQKR